MRRAPFLAIASVALLLAGCNDPSPTTPAPASTGSASTVPPPEYAVAVVVTQETPSGAPLRAQVQGIPLLADGTLGEMLQRGTGEGGAARFRFSAPTTLLVRVLAPDGWTSEGARVHVGTSVAAEGLTVSDHDVFVPLYRSSLSFAAQQAWSTAAAQPSLDLGVAPAVAVHDLVLPEGLQGEYLARLTEARVVASWTDGEDGRALNASSGLAWDGAVWVEGAGAPVAASGARQATWEGRLPADGRPSDLDAARLQVALLTRTAIVGEVVFGLEATLRFGGQVPAQFPPDDCHGLLC